MRVQGPLLLHSQFRNENLCDLIECNDENEPVEEEPKMCLICKANDGISPMINYNNIIETCFGVTVKNPSFTICDRCAELVQTTSAFRQLIRDVLSHNNVLITNTRENIKQEPCSYHDEVKVLNAKSVYKSNDSLRRYKKSGGTKTYSKCDVCKNKYLRLVRDVDQGAVASFVCPRCKHKPPTYRVLQCDKCNTIVPAQNMIAHLEEHARSNLFSRCRLRSLQKPVSKISFTAPSLKQVSANHDHTKSSVLNCKFCGRIFKSQVIFDRHCKIHMPTTEVHGM